MGDILVNVGFDVGSSSPIDSRTLKDTIDERDALMYEGKVYENLKVYCKDTKTEYRWTGTEWEEVGTGGSGSGTDISMTDYYTKTEVDNDFLKKTDAASTYATKTDIETMSSIILDSEVRLDKTYSSSKIYTDIQDAIDTSKAYTLSELGKMSGASYKVVTATNEMTDEKIIYLLNNGTTFDMYIVDNGTPTKIGDTDVDLSDYYTKTEVDNDFLKKTDATSIYATKTELNEKANDDEVAKKADITDLQEQIDNLDIPGLTDMNAKLVQLENNQIKKLTLQNQSQNEIYIKIAACNGDNFSKILFTDPYGGSILITGGILTGVDYKTIKVVRLTNGDWTSYNPSTHTLNKIQNVYLGGTDIYIKCGPYTTFYIEGGFISAEKVYSIPSDVTQLPILDLTQQTDNGTNVNDIPKTTLTPEFPGVVRVGSGGVAINYIVKNGWCNVNFAFNLASATTFPWTGIATGLPKPAYNSNILLMDETGKVNRTIAIRINTTGTVASRIPVAFTATDWWCGNISYPVAE